MNRSSSSAPVTSMMAVPLIRRTSRFSSELSANSNSEFSPRRIYDPGFSSISTRPSRPVLTTSPVSKSSLMVSCRHSEFPWGCIVARPVTALTPPARAEMTNFSRFWLLLLKGIERINAATTNNGIRAARTFLMEFVPFGSNRFRLTVWGGPNYSPIVAIYKPFTTVTRRELDRGLLVFKTSRIVAVFRACGDIQVILNLNADRAPLSVPQVVRRTIANTINPPQVSYHLLINIIQVFQLVSPVKPAAAGFGQLRELIACHRISQARGRMPPELFFFRVEINGKYNCLYVSDYLQQFVKTCLGSGTKNVGKCVIHSVSHHNYRTTPQ